MGMAVGCVDDASRWRGTCGEACSESLLSRHESLILLLDSCPIAGFISMDNALWLVVDDEDVVEDVEDDSVLLMEVGEIVAVIA